MMGKIWVRQAVPVGTDNTGKNSSAVEERQGVVRIAYAVSDSGHRGAYVSLMCTTFGLQPLISAATPATVRQLVMAKGVLFTSLDDDLPTFVFVSLLRAIRGKPTAALFLRAETCFSRYRWYHVPKYLLFRVLRHVSKISVITITPFDVTPRYAEVADFGVCDPQYWDLVRDTKLPIPPTTRLSAEISLAAGTRRIVTALGFLNENKGLGFVADMLEEEPRLAQTVLFVCAGRIRDDAASLAARLKAAGVIVIGRALDDDELASLYGVAHAVWACYAPAYDQASGIFGRALQYAVPPIVRKGSVVAAFAERQGIATIELDYDMPGSGTLLYEKVIGLSLAAAVKSTPEDMTDKRIQLILRWQLEFKDVVTRALPIQ